MNTPAGFYCPSEYNTQFQLNGGAAGAFINPWPPLTTNVGQSANTRVGYGTRPTVDWPQPGGSGLLPTLFPTKMDKLRSLRNLAVAADPVSNVNFIETRHRIGINVAYADGSARWVPRRIFDTTLRQLSIDFNVNTSASNVRLLDTSAVPATGLWTLLDKQ